jgi:general secretion pathway protein A
VPEIFYGNFYGLDSPPFHITPDPSLLFGTQTHEQALATVEYGIASGKGFVVVTGEVGVGKTTVLKMCLAKLDSSKAKIIYLFNPALDIPELYETLLDELDVPPSSTKRKVHSLHRLQRALLAVHARGAQVILAVDEAQNMPDATLEALRLLSNLETAKSKLLQIILVGQPELDAKLAKHELRQLAQRIAVRARIERLSWRQSRAYLVHRIRCAGRPANRPLFTEPALWYLAFVARGIPRTLNIAGDNALINGYGAGTPRISLSIAREACRSLQARVPVSRFAWAAAILAGLAIAVAMAVHEPLGSIVGPATAAVTMPKPVSLPTVTAPAPQAATEAPPPASESPLSRAQAPAPAPAADLASTAPMPDTAPPAVAPTRDSVVAVPAPAPAPRGQNRDPVWRWFVRKGDSLYKVCRRAYGFCDDETMRAIYAHNPSIEPDAKIRRGQVLIMPQRIESAGPN